MVKIAILQTGKNGKLLTLHFHFFYFGNRLYQLFGFSSSDRTHAYDYTLFILVVVVWWLENLACERKDQRVDKTLLKLTWHGTEPLTSLWCSLECVNVCVSG